MTGPTVTFVANVLLPSSFFGPLLATYVLVRLISKVRWERGVWLSVRL